MQTLTYHAKSLLARPGLWLAFAAVILCFFGFVDVAHASDATSSSSSNLPWDSPMQTLRADLSGPVAFGIALIGIVATGATLIWGGEISEFARRMVYVVLVICVIVFANTMLTGTLFSGATIPANIHVSAADLAQHAKPAHTVAAHG